MAFTALSTSPDLRPTETVRLGPVFVVPQLARPLLRLGYCATSGKNGGREERGKGAGSRKSIGRMAEMGWQNDLWI